MSRSLGRRADGARGSHGALKIKPYPGRTDGWLEGGMQRRQNSLRVSSSVAEGVLTPAALHLRVSAEVERQGPGRVGGVGGCGLLLGWLNGPKSHIWPWSGQEK